METNELVKLPTVICIVVGIISTFYFRKLNTTERLILLVVYLNIITDLIAIYLADTLKQDNGIIYNIFCPTEKIITLLIYYLNAFQLSNKRLNILGVLFVCLFSLYGFIANPATHFHTEVYILSGFIVSILSYLQLRQIIQEKAKQSTAIFFFAIANLVYYTLMVSSVSASPFAYELSEDFGKAVMIGNQVAYSLWSILILIGLLWNRTKI